MTNTPGSGTGGAGDANASGTTSLDAGFDGLGDKAGKAGLDSAAGDDAALNSLKDGLSEKLGFLDGLGFGWVPVPRDFAQCKPIPYSILGLSSAWNLCPYVYPLAQAMGYLFYVFTAMHLYRLFTSSTKE